MKIYELPVSGAAALCEQTPDLSPIGDFRFTTMLDRRGNLPVNQKTVDALKEDLEGLEELAGSTNDEGDLVRVIERVEQLNKFKIQIEVTLAIEKGAIVPAPKRQRIVPAGAGGASKGHEKQPQVTVRTEARMTNIKSDTKTTSTTTWNSTSNNCVYNYHNTYVTHQAAPSSSTDNKLLKEVLENQRQLQKTLSQTQSELNSMKRKLNGDGAARSGATSIGRMAIGNSSLPALGYGSWTLGKKKL
jgi:hypothetical protein